MPIDEREISGVRTTIADWESYALPTEDEMQGWIRLAYREPEDASKIDAFRFTRWNMEVAYLAGFQEARRRTGAAR